MGIGKAWQIPTPASQRVDFLVGPTTGGGPGNIPSLGFLCNWLSTAQCGFVVPYGFCMFIKQAASCLSAVCGEGGAGGQVPCWDLDGLTGPNTLGPGASLLLT